MLCNTSCEYIMGRIIFVYIVNIYNIYSLMIIDRTRIFPSPVADIDPISIVIIILYFIHSLPKKNTRLIHSYGYRLVRTLSKICIPILIFNDIRTLNVNFFIYVYCITSVVSLIVITDS